MAVLSLEYAIVRSGQAMEDLSVEHDVCDQITGISLETQAKLFDVMAGLHAKYFMTPLLDEPWLHSDKGAYKPWWFVWWNTFATNQQQFTKYCEVVKTNPTVEVSTDGNGDPGFQEMVEIMMSDKGPAIGAKIMDTWGTRPYTLCHGDFRSLR